MAIRWWRTVHPVVFDSGGANLEPVMLATLIFSVITFTLLFCSLLSHRLRLGSLAQQVERLKRR
jgi:heme exporter protein C